MKRRRSPLGCLVSALMLAAVCAAGGYLCYRYLPTNERADLAEIYDAGGTDRVALFLNCERQEADGIYANGQTYLPIDWVNEYLNERFYWDANEKLLVYALPEEIVTAGEETKGENGQPLLLCREDGVYLALGLVLNYTDIRLSAYDGGEYRRVYVENGREPVAVADVDWDGKVRVRGGVKSPVITQAQKGDTVVVLETLENWARVMTQDGHIGYMYSRKLSNLREETPQSDFEEPVYRNISLDEKIVMVWHQVTNEAANHEMETLLASTKGVNVIAPTWFTMSSNEGDYESLASRSYVDQAHALGLQVWAVIDNFSRECSRNVQTEVLLSRTSVRRALIDRLMAEADTYGFDGINLDFESLKEEAGVHYVQFIRELSVACRERGLVLSVDNYVPAAYNRFYNRKEQGIVADYVIIMGYDEHYAGGEAGSVSSLGYVDQGIRDTLELVPAEKVINGVPFFTRLWTESADGVSSQAMGMGAAARWARDQDVALTWDETCGQYYGEKETEDGLCRLWLEDARSLGLKMDRIREYDLAGVAGWKLGLESPEAWDAVTWTAVTD